MRAVLRNSSGDALANKVVTFNVGELTLSATTDVEGTAEVRIPPDQQTGDYTLHAGFGGDHTYLSSSFDTALSVRRMHGLCYSPFRDGQDPNVGIYPSSEEIGEDMAMLASLTGTVRTYGASNTLSQIPAIAKAYSLSVWQGVWLGEDDQGNASPVNEDEISGAAEIVNLGLADVLIVGNETVLLNVFTKDQLIEYIKKARQVTPAGIPVTTGEGWRVWLDNPDLVGQVDFILAHIYSYWDEDPRDHGLAYVVESYNQLRAKYPDKRIVIGETGWPSCGAARGGSVPGEDNQRQFLQGFTKWASENSVEYTYFDALDEEWKWREGETSDNSAGSMPLDRNFSGHYAGSSWGLFRSDGTMKPWLDDFLGEGVPTSQSRLMRTICTADTLSAGYDLGVNSSENRTDWLLNLEEIMCMAYPANQDWGAVFITLRDTEQRGVGERPWRDFSMFGRVSVDLRGEHGGEKIRLATKDRDDRDDGSEAKVTVNGLSAKWETFVFPLSAFSTTDFEDVYVAMEFVFSGSEAQTVYCRNVRYLP